MKIGRMDDHNDLPVDEGVAFTYEPLPDDNHIRLATIQSSPQGKPVLRVLLFKAPIALAKDFVALSYCWGDQNEKVPIICNGKKFEITANLHAALTRITADSKDGLLCVWADALCINQEDVDERSSHITLMGRIYSSAKEVVIWLGAEEDDTTLAFDTLKDFAHRWNQVSRLDYHGAPQDQIDELMDPEVGTEDVKLSAIKKLCSRPWFERTWTYQEAVLAKQATVLCGHQEIEWDDLKMANFWLINSGVIAEVLNHGYNTVIGIVNAQRVVSGEIAEGDPLALLYLLQHRRQSKATDPRDKVYGLLGIATNRGSLAPDYRRSLAEAYMETTRVLIVESRSLEVLNATYPLERASDLPSWAADWREDLDGWQLGLRSGQNGFPYHASSGSHPSIISSADQEQLKLKGFQLDRIQTVHDARSALACSADGTWLLATGQLRACPASLGLTGTYAHTSEPYSIAYATTLWADMMPYSGRGSEYFNSFLFSATLAAMKAEEEDKEVSSETPSQSINPRVIREILTEPGAGEVPEQELSFLQDLPDGIVSDASSLASKDGEVVREMVEFIGSMTHKRVFFITEKGYIGIGFDCAQVGDIVVILLGGITPYVLRQQDENYLFLGESYVHGVMDGEAFNAHVEAGKEFEVFSLV
jgi:hypothetical protein